MLLVVPLAWLQLTYERGRLLVAIAGVMFAVVLITMQLGFQDALFKSAILIHESLRGDLVLIHPSSTNIINMTSFSQRRLYQALKMDGVASVQPLYIGLAAWRAPDLGVTEDILILGAKPEGNIFQLPEVEQQIHKVATADVILFDRGSREDFYGAIAAEFTNASQTGGIVTREIANRKITVGGLFKLGISFAANGTLITSDLNFLRIFDRRQAGLIDVGLITLQPGADKLRLKEQLRSQLDRDVRVLTMPEFVAFERNYWDEATPIGFVFGLGVTMGFIVGIVIVYQVLYKEVSDHMAEYATLKAMGYSNIYLFRVILGQSVLLSILGCIPGLIICTLLYALTRDATGLLMEMSLERIITIMLLTNAMCIISGAIALNKLRSADPADIFI